MGLLVLSCRVVSTEPFSLPILMCLTLLSGWQYPSLPTSFGCRSTASKAVGQSVRNYGLSMCALMDTVITSEYIWTVCLIQLEKHLEPTIWAASKVQAASNSTWVCRNAWWGDRTQEQCSRWYTERGLFIVGDRSIWTHQKGGRWMMNIPPKRVWSFMDLWILDVGVPGFDPQPVVHDDLIDNVPR